MKTFIAAIVLTFALPAAANAQGAGQANHARHQGMDHSQHQGMDHGKEHKDCCKHKNADGTPMACCKSDKAGAKMACCEKHEAKGKHSGHGMNH